VRLLIRLIKILAVIRDLANRGIRGRRNLHQIQALFLGHAQRLKWLHHAKLSTIFIDNPYFARPNSLIDPDPVGLSEITFCDNSPLLRLNWNSKLSVKGRV
jgi:hypothetical protein